jgi:oligoribonuclease NrnB/cAMP/cGMP phosphodiesterase (DHH superfamily)
MTLSKIAMPLAVAGVLALSSAQAQQTPAPAQPDLAQRALQNKGMMNYDRMIADMTAADARLEELTIRMKSAEGDEKIAAMQDVVSELVTNQVYMHHMASAMIHKMTPH